MVIDVRADDRIEAADAEAFAVTAAACARLGWEFRRVGEIDPVPGRTSAGWPGTGIRGAPAGPGLAAAAEAFAAPAPLLAGAAEAGDPLAMLPALFHLMWRQELVADVTRERLGPATLVRAAAPKVSTGERGMPPRAAGPAGGR